MQYGDIKNYFTKSLFNHFVFNTVITRAKTLVVAVGKPLELLEFEDKNIENTKGELKCWHEYLNLCAEEDAISNLHENVDELVTRLDIYITSK